MNLENWTRDVSQLMKYLGITVMMAGIAVGILTASPEPVQAQEGVINLDETVIKGRIQKPEAFYILQHANLNYQSLDPKPTFIPELLETVEGEPF